MKRSLEDNIHRSRPTQGQLTHFPLPPAEKTYTQGKIRRDAPEHSENNDAHDTADNTCDKLMDFAKGVGRNGRTLQMGLDDNGFHLCIHVHINI